MPEKNKSSQETDINIPLFWRIILFFGIVYLAINLRFFNINWDQNQHLHPDERFLTMVAGSISWPSDLWEYLSAELSPLNPHNRGYGFYVYGTFPLFFTKWVAEFAGQGDYNGLTLIGRQLSAVFDVGIVALVFLIANQISLMFPSVQAQDKGKFRSLKSKKTILYKLFGFGIFPLLSMFLYSIMVLPIQLSHFFAVDTYLTFFLTLSFYLLIKIINFTNKILNSKFLILHSLLGISFGLAIASKISAVYFLPIIGLGLIITLIKNRNLLRFIVVCCLLFVICYLTIRLAQPYLFAHPDLFDLSLNKKIVDNWKQLKSFDNPNSMFPPGIQWIKTRMYIFPLKNMLLWGLGLPLGIMSVLAVVYYVLRIMYYAYKRKIYLILNSDSIGINLSLLFILMIFIYQGFQFVKAIRYFYPIYPFLAIITGLFITQILEILKRKFHLQNNILTFSYLSILASFLIYPLSFISIYSHPHSRIQASEWIYNNIPNGSKISGEHWDDFLPIRLPDSPPITYTSVELPLYNPDTKAKWIDMADRLKETDYIVLSSSRLYGSIMTVPEKYPITNKYYQSLFDGSLGFTKVAEFTSRPNITIPFIKLCLTPPFSHYGIISYKDQVCKEGISFVDDYADEVFTVYDHPKVIIFRKTKQIDFYKFLFGNYQPQIIN